MGIDHSRNCSAQNRYSPTTTELFLLHRSKRVGYDLVLEVGYFACGQLSGRSLDSADAGLTDYVSITDLFRTFDALF